MPTEAETRAALALTIARLQSLRVVESLCALLAAAALIGATLNNGVARILFVSAVLAALLCIYACIRVRIDVVLFERWEQLDSTALDQALLALNPQFQVGRTLESRINGSLAWWRRGLYALCLQVALSLVAVVLS